LLKKPVAYNWAVGTTALNAILNVTYVMSAMDGQKGAIVVAICGAYVVWNGLGFVCTLASKGDFELGTRVVIPPQFLRPAIVETPSAPARVTPTAPPPPPPPAEPGPPPA